MTMFIDELPLLFYAPSNKRFLATELCTLPATTYLWVYLIYDSATKDPVQRNVEFADSRFNSPSTESDNFDKMISKYINDLNHYVSF